MKKQLLICLSLIAALFASAQVSTPNGNFESWTSGTFEYPQYYPGNSNPETFLHCHTPFNVTKSTTAQHGSFALQITTNANAPDTCFGYVTNASNANSGGPGSWTGGMAISQKPLGIKGFYQYNVASVDSALIIVTARKNGANVGMFMYLLGGVHSTYTPFNFTFSPALA